MKMNIPVFIMGMLLSCIVWGQEAPGSRFSMHRNWRSEGSDFDFGVNQFPFNSSLRVRHYEDFNFHLQSRIYAPDGGGSFRLGLDFFILPKTEYKYYVTGYYFGYFTY